MSRYIVGLVVLLAGILPLSVHATPVTVGQLYGFGFTGPGDPLVSGVGFGQPTNPPGVATPATPWTFTLATPGTLTVLDLFLSVDKFEIFDFGVSLGLTSAPTIGGPCGSDFTCALADLFYSRGIFNLAVGNYSITGAQTIGQPGAGAFIVQSASVPLPATLALVLLAIGMLGAGITRMLRNWGQT